MESLIQRQQSVATYQASLQLAFTEEVLFEEAVEICGPSGCQEGQVFKPVSATFQDHIKMAQQNATGLHRVTCLINLIDTTTI